MESEQFVGICNPRHESRIFAFCQSNNCYVCEECFQRDHRTHSIEHLKFMARDQIKIARELEASLNAALSRFEEDSRQFSTKKLSEVISTSVKNYYNKLIKHLQASCNVIVQDLLKGISGEFERIEKTVKNLSGNRDRMMVLLGNVRQQIKIHEKSILCNQYKWFHEYTRRLADYQNSCAAIEKEMTEEIRLLEKSLPEVAFRLSCEEVTEMIEKNMEILNHSRAVSPVPKPRSESSHVSARGRSPSSSFRQSYKSPLQPKTKSTIPHEITPIKKNITIQSEKKNMSSKSVDSKSSIKVSKSKELSTRKSPGLTRNNSFSASSGSNVFCFLDPNTSSLIKLSLVSLNISKINVKAKKPFPEGFGAVENKGQLLLTGGECNSIIINECLEINCTNGIITGKCPMQTHRRNHGIVCLFNVAYVVGGYNTTSNILPKCEKYNFAMNTWEALPELNCERNFMACCVVGEKQLYCFGGSALEAVRGVCSFEWLSLIATDKWHYAEMILNSDPIAYGAGCIQVKRDEVLIFGGLNESEYFDQVWKFKPSTGSVVFLGKSLKAKDAFYQRCPQIVGGKAFCLGFLTKCLHICDLKLYEWSMNALHL